MNGWIRKWNFILTWSWKWKSPNARSPLQLIHSRLGNHSDHKSQVSMWDWFSMSVQWVISRASAREQFSHKKGIEWFIQVSLIFMSLKQKVSKKLPKSILSTKFITRVTARPFLCNLPISTLVQVMQCFA